MAAKVGYDDVEVGTQLPAQTFQITVTAVNAFFVRAAGGRNRNEINDILV